MNERLKFVVGQKKRLLNQISSRISNFKIEDKNVGIFLSIEEDGHLRVPRDFVDPELPTLLAEYGKLTKKEKQAYDKKYFASTSFLIDSYNEANKKYNSIFEEFDVYEKIDTLNEEIRELEAEQKRANLYLNTLARQSKQKQQAKFDSKTKLSEKVILEVNQEITQIAYIEAGIRIKTKLLNELKESL